MNEKRHKALLGEYDGIAQGKKILEYILGSSMSSANPVV